MKVKLTQEEYDALSDDLKSEYKEGEGDNAGSFFLVLDDVSVHPDTQPLVTAKQHEKKARQDAEAARREAEKKLKEKEEKEEAERQKAAIDNVTGDDDVAKAAVAEVKQAYETKLNTLEQIQKKNDEKKDSVIEKMMIENAVDNLANEMCGENAKLIKPHLKDRYGVDMTGDEPELYIKDKEGKRSVMTVDELRKEFVDNAMFKPIIKASKASGSDASGSHNGGSAPKKFEEMSGSELVNLKNTDRPLYDRLKKERDERREAAAQL